MHRATREIAGFLVLVGYLVVSAPARAQSVDYVDGIGLLDYRQTPKLEVGSWAKYRISAKSERGRSDDYFVTVLIAGEERFWGEDCFWIETWTGTTDENARAIANLVSYDIFNDPEQYTYAKYYSRKSIMSFVGGDQPDESVTRLPPASLKSRDKVVPTWTFDTLGTETIEGPKGPVDCVKILAIREGQSTAKGVDSTRTTTVQDRRVDYWSKTIPITGIVREEIEFRASIDYVRKGEPDSLGRRKADVTIGTVELVDYGTGAEPLMVPEAKRKSFAEQDAGQARNRGRNRAR